MSLFKGFSCLLACCCLICLCNCQDSFVSMTERLDRFEEELLHNKVNIFRVEQNVFNIIDVAKASITAELKENIRVQVREAMAEFLEGGSFQGMVKKEAISELRHVKRGYHQMKRRLNHVSKSLDDLKDETIFHKSLIEKSQVWNQTNSSDICVSDKQGEEMELKKGDVSAANLKADMERIMELNESCESRISQLKTALDVSSQGVENVTPTSRPLVLTTPRQEEKRSRILISSSWSYVQNQFRQINIENNSLSIYQYHSLSAVTSLEYIAKTNKLLIGLRSSAKILSSTLDTDHVTVLKRDVAVPGMAVDEHRDIVFMSTYRPRYSISRMSIKGKDFTIIIDLSNYGDIPRQIALDTRRKKIYGCNADKVFTVTYDGQDLATLARGRNIHALTLDLKVGVLYYNHVRQLMKMTMSNNVSTEVTSLRAYPRNMRLYSGIIYYGGYDPSIIGAVNVTQDAVAYTLKYIRMIGASSLQVCLIP